MNVNEKQLPLVTYEQAQRLKKAGFDWTKNPCYTPYGNEAEHIPIATRQFKKIEDKCYPAPTVALALKWLRDVKGFLYEQSHAQEIDNYESIGYHFIISLPRGMFRHTGNYDTYEAAESALMDELLKLIENEN